jgi:hypothetical protein
MSLRTMSNTVSNKRYLIPTSGAEKKFHGQWMSKVLNKNALFCMQGIA